MRVKVRPFIGVGSGEVDYEYSIPMTVFDNYLGQIHDWYTRTINNEDAIFSYDWDQARDASDEWHAAGAGKGEGKIYEPTNQELIVYSPPEWKGWSIQRVMSENDMLVEGNLMSHCVGDYCEDVERGNIEVYSLRDPKNRPHVTIGLDPKYDDIFQLQGNSNSEPDEEYKVYLREWLPLLQKERPDLKIGEEEQFDFDDLKYVNDDEIDEEINRIAYEGDEYGLKGDLIGLDIESAYDAAIVSLSRGGQNYDNVRYVSYIGTAIADVAWDADKRRAEKAGLLGKPYDDKSKEYISFKHESRTKGVQWLWGTIEKNNESLYNDFFDWLEPQAKKEDFETEEEFEKAEEEERDESATEFRRSSLPYALDDAIVKELVELDRTMPFLPKPPPSHTFSMKKNWLQKIG